MEKLKRLQSSIQNASYITLASLLVHYLCFYRTGCPLWTEAIAKWIMARTPSVAALWMLDRMGSWAKPFSLTGGLATLGFLVWVIYCSQFLSNSRFSKALILGLCTTITAVVMGRYFEVSARASQISFWLPVFVLASWSALRSPAGEVLNRRDFLSSATRAAMPVVMSAGVVLVALESYLRNQQASRRARLPVPLYHFEIPSDRKAFGAGLVRPEVTPVQPVDTFYKMSHSAFDPVIDPEHWNLRVTIDGQLLRRLTYEELLSLPPVERWITLRCVSNTLKTNLMGNASWFGVKLSQIVAASKLPNNMVEAAFIGEDGHGDSFTIPYAFSEEPLLAFGMNGETLNRAHGFPIRFLAPRYYGFKSVKWLSEIAFVSKPYFGTWPKLGFTKEPLIHTASSIDRMRPEGDSMLLGGVSFAGTKGIREVQVRAAGGQWASATLEPPLSPYTWTRWTARLPIVPPGTMIEARAQDGLGNWQESSEGPLFPDGRTGPTLRRFSS